MFPSSWWDDKFKQELCVMQKQPHFLCCRYNMAVNGTGFSETLSQDKDSSKGSLEQTGSCSDPLGYF